MEINIKEDNDIINITDLCQILKNSLPNNKFKIIGEVSQPKISQGHLYLTLKDTNSTIKAIIWKTKLDKQINEGDKILVVGRLDYYGFTGTISLIIDKILENEGIGELQKKYDLLKSNFLAKGYFDKKNKMKLPEIIKKILIITSKNGAAIHDFLFNLENNKSKIQYDIIDTPVQGSDSPQIIANILNDLENIDYDLIIITRGGGSFQDLFGFSDSVLIESVFNFKKIPIISAIGHQVDNPLLDLVADYSCPTPSLAAQLLVDINRNYINKLQNLKIEFNNQISYDVNNSQKQLLIQKNRLRNIFQEIKNISCQFSTQITNEVNNYKLKLEYIKKSLDNPNIELFDCAYNKINKVTEIIKDNIMILKWNNQEFKIKFI